MTQIGIGCFVEVEQQVLGSGLRCRLGRKNSQIISIAVGIEQSQLVKLVAVGCKLTNFAVVIRLNAIVSCVNGKRNNVLLAVCFINPKVDTTVEIVAACQLLVESVTCKIAHVCLVGVTVHIDDVGFFNVGIGVDGGHGARRLFILIACRLLLFLITRNHTRQKHAQCQEANKNFGCCFHFSLLMTQKINYWYYNKSTIGCQVFSEILQNILSFNSVQKKHTELPSSCAFC